MEEDRENLKNWTLLKLGSGFKALSQKEKGLLFYGVA